MLNYYLYLEVIDFKHLNTGTLDNTGIFGNGHKEPSRLLMTIGGHLKTYGGLFCAPSFWNFNVEPVPKIKKINCDSKSKRIF